MTDDAHILDQALFGYRSGHRQIVASRQIANDDRKTLLIYTDRSASNDSLPEQGYLTGLRLPGSSAYALIKTWPAPEVGRPGCVWSHVLLIDYATLGRLKNLSSLGALFRRPMGTESEYSDRIQLIETPSPHRFQFQPDELANLLNGLYGAGNTPFQTHRSSIQNPEQAIIAIWSQQWPRLRRSFQFCTFSDTMSASRYREFDLQFQAKGTNQPSSIGSIFPVWLDVALQDILTASGDLQQFFLDHASDIGGGRSAFRPLCELYSELVSNPDSKHAHAAVQLIGTAFAPDEAQRLKATVLSRAIDVSASMDKAELSSLVLALERTGLELETEKTRRLVASIWRRDPALILESSMSPKLLHALENVLPTLEVSEIVLGLEAAPALVPRALSIDARPLSSPEAWRSNIAPVLLSEVSALVLGIDAQTWAVAFLENASPRYADAGSTAFGAKTLIDALTVRPDLVEKSLSRAILLGFAETSDFDEVLSLLALSPHLTIPRELLEEIAVSASRFGKSARGATQNTESPDPWATMYRRAKLHERLNYPPSVLDAWLFQRALNSTSEVASDLFSLSVDRLWDVLNPRSSSSDSIASRLRQTLVATEWLDWSTEQDRFERTIAEACRSKRFSPEELLHISTFDKRLARIVRRLGERAKGRTYLRALVLFAKEDFDLEINDRLNKVMHLAFDD